MVNHEVTYKCNNCGLSYDARLYGAVCPECASINSTPARCVSKTGTPIFHISDAALLGAGFKREEECFSDLSTFNNTRVVTFTKAITKKTSIEVCFYYHAETPGAFEMLESTATLDVGDEDQALSITSLSDLILFIDRLTKTVKKEKE